MSKRCMFIFISVLAFLVLSSFVSAPFIVERYNPNTMVMEQVPLSSQSEIASMDKGEMAAADMQGATPTEMGHALDTGRFPDNRLSELTSQQMEGNLDKLKGKENLLNQDEYNAAIQEKIGNPNAEIGAGDEAANVETTGDRADFERATTAKTQDTEMQGVEKGTIHKDGRIEAEKVEKLEAKGSDGNVEAQVKTGEGVKYDPNTKTLDIKSADSVAFTVPDSPPVVALNVPESTFINHDDRLEIIPKEDATYTIMDHGQNAVIADVKKGNEFIIAKEPEPRYTLKEGSVLLLPQYGLLVNATEDDAEVILNKRGANDVHLEGTNVHVQFLTRGLQESLWAKGKSVIRANKLEGMYYAELGNPSRLTFNNGQIEKSFMILRDHDNNPYYLVINKPSYQMDIKDFKERYIGREAGYINLDTHQQYYQGRIDYSKFDPNHKPKLLFESEDRENMIDLTLDESNKLIEHLNIENPYHDCKTEKILISVHNFEYNIIEVCNPNTKNIERYIGFEHLGTPNYLQRYSSKFRETHNDVVFSGKLLMIPKKKSTSMFFSTATAEQFMKGEMDAYNTHFEECIPYHQKIIDKPSILEWFLT